MARRIRVAIVVSALAAVVAVVGCTPEVAQLVPKPTAPPVSGFVGGTYPPMQQVYGCSLLGGYVWASIEVLEEGLWMPSLSATVWRGYGVSDNSILLGNIADFANKVEGNAALVQPGECFTVVVQTVVADGDPTGVHPAKYTLNW